MGSGRLLIVSNRLPLTVQTAGDEVRLVEASGGLATGMRPHHARSGGLWLGWPGDVSALTPAQRGALDAGLRARAIVPVHLSREHVERFYLGFANRVLWPLFHYLIDRVPVDATGWEAYRQVNEAFAEAVANEYRPGDTIWVHDYQLMLLPALLRERLPEARIGFFLHIPFPSSEVFRTLPWRREILAGLLGADLVGFHTFAYLRHFLASLLHVDGLESDIDRVRVGDREVRCGVFPMGVDAARFTALAADAGVRARAAAIRREAGERRILLGIDRLDYTKGIPRRLHAVERLLTTSPDLRDRVRFIQVAVPSRGEVDSYQRFKRQVEEAVGRVNGSCGTVRSTPVHYIHQSIDERELAALYLAADVMVVTPLRDGMNLVAKEFVATRGDLDGVLVLSEFAGAAAELDGAVTVNPYDVQGVAEVLRHTLAIPRKERAARMRAMRRRVVSFDVHHWAAAFLGALEEVRPALPATATRPQPALETVLHEAAGRQLRLLLTYDGTLVPLARAPHLAAPDDELLALLRALAAAPGVRLEIVSGRGRDTLERWLGVLDIPLSAEHGFWFRPGAGQPWQPAATVGSDWLDRLAPTFDAFAAMTPGAQVERKTASIAWHYRRAQRHFGARQAHELRMLLGDTLSNQPLEVLEGSKVIEVRTRGVSKALAAQRAMQDDALVVAIGDDTRDGELFRALPPSSVTVAVGGHPAAARYQLADYRAVRRVLRLLLGHRRRSLAALPPAYGRRPVARAQLRIDAAPVRRARRRAPR